MVAGLVHAHDSSSSSSSFELPVPIGTADNAAAGAAAGRMMGEVDGAGAVAEGGGDVFVDPDSFGASSAAGGGGVGGGGAKTGMSSEKPYKLPFASDDVDQIASIAYNYGVTLVELGQAELAERFVCRALGLLKHTSPVMSQWREKMQETYLAVLKAKEKEKEATIKGSGGFGRVFGMGGMGMMGTEETKSSSSSSSSSSSFDGGPLSFASFTN